MNPVHSVDSVRESNGYFADNAISGKIFLDFTKLFFTITNSATESFNSEIQLTKERHGDCTDRSNFIGIIYINGDDYFHHPLDSKQNSFLNKKT